MTILTIDPRDMDVMSWTAQMAINLDAVGPIQTLLAPNRWQDWGAHLLAIASLSGILIPDPYQFDDWREWAMRTNEGLDSKS